MKIKNINKIKLKEEFVVISIHDTALSLNIEWLLSKFPLQYPESVQKGDRGFIRLKNGMVFAGYVNKDTKGYFYIPASSIPAEFKQRPTIGHPIPLEGEYEVVEFVLDGRERRKLPDDDIYGII